MKAPRAHETSQISRERGFYKDPDPRFKDLKGKFDDAARTNGEKQIKLAAIYSVLAKFALLDEMGDPIEGLTKMLKDDDFGYTDRKPKGPGSMRDEKPLWGPNAGMGAGSVADRLGFNSNERYGGV